MPLTNPWPAGGSSTYVAQTQAVITEVGTKLDGTPRKPQLTVNWSDYTLDSDGLVAAAAAAGAGGAVFAPKGPAGSEYAYSLDYEVTLDEVSLVSDGATINCASDFGAGKYALIVTSASGTRPNMRVGGFRLLGPTQTRTLGVAPCAMHGIKVAGQAKPHFRDAWVRYFNRGEDLANDVGHVYHDHVIIDNCYYGTYLSQSGFDYYWNECTISGNVFANFGSPSDQAWASCAWRNSHIGFAPYAFYVESTPINQGSKLFLADCVFDNARFEAIGNAAFRVTAQDDGSNHSLWRDVEILHPGFSWNATYELGTEPQNYAIDITRTAGYTRIQSGLYPFETGDLGIVHIGVGGHGMFAIQTATIDYTKYVSDSGGTVLLYGASADGAISVSEPGANTVVDLPGTTTNYIDFSPSHNRTKRIGADSGTGIFVDAPNVIFRNSGSGYATGGEINGSSRLWFTQIGITSSSGPFWSSGTGTPEAVVTAPPGSLFSRTDGGASTTLYVKTSGSGNTGWTAK